nr:MAG TPA: hypothetical protein [Caudoviricetes sp.]
MATMQRTTLPIADGDAYFHAAGSEIADAVFQSLVLTEVDASKRCHLHL